MNGRSRSLCFVLALAAGVIALASGPAAADYTSGIGMDARGPYFNTYIAPYYAPPYAGPATWPPPSYRYTPILMTSINYPGVYGRYSMSIAALDWRGPIMYPDQYATAPARLETVTFRPQAAPESRAEVEVRLPANAELWFQGVRMSELGAYRRFLTPPLSPGRSYGYDVRATWTANGQPVTQERHVRVTGGDRLVIDFNEPATIERGTSELRSLPLPK